MKARALPPFQRAILLHLLDHEEIAGEGATVPVKDLPCPKLLGVFRLTSERDREVSALIVCGHVELVGDREHVQLTHRGRVQAQLQRILV